MTDRLTHLLVTGARRVDRLQTMRALADPDVVASCHARLRGPYSGMRGVLPEIVTAAAERGDDVIDAHRLSLLYAVPELADAIGPAPQSLVASTPHEERTRYFGQDLLRSVSQGIITFLIDYASRLGAERDRPLTLALDDVDCADLTERELVAVLVRRADPATLRIVVGAARNELAGELGDALARHTQRVPASKLPPAADPRTPAERARGYVLSDGTSDDPAEQTAYRALASAERQRLHDARAGELEARADWGLRLGAIPYHREQGSDPQGAGRRALREALEYAVAVGFSAATVDLGMRGRRVCDPVAHQSDYCHFSAKAASALVPLGDLDACLEIYRELRRRYPLPRVHLTCAYALAMLYTRFLTPRDHDQALEWINTARALASQLTDPVEAPVLQGYEDNGLALIEMHRGNLTEALELVDRAIDRLDRDVPADCYVVHRTQLLHNRARLYVALGRLDDAFADFTRLTEWDPWYFEYHSDRGNVARKRGDAATALAEYDRAIEVSVPMPPLYYNRASMRAEIGDRPGALADLDYLLAMDPASVPGRLLRATLRLDGQDVAGALEDARAGLEQSPDDPSLLSVLALAQQADGELEQALASFDRALEADPRFVPALGDRAVLTFEMGDGAAALRDLTSAVALRGDDPDLRFNRGFVLAHLDRPAEAVQEFTDALDLPDADRLELLTHRATCLLRLGDATAAAADIAGVGEFDEARATALRELTGTAATEVQAGRAPMPR